MAEFTFEQLMAAADRADRAGDADAARDLVRAAQATPGYAVFAERQSQPVAATPPRVEQWAPTEPRKDRLGDTIEAATRGPRRATAQFAKRTVAPGRTPVQRAGDAGMTALAGLGTGIAGAAGTVGEVLGGSPTGERQLARDLMLGSQVAVPELAGVASTTRLAGRAARQTVTEMTPRQDQARAAAELGVTPSLGMTGKAGGMAAATLEKVPTAGGIIARDAERAIGEVEGAFKRITASLGEAETPSLAGQRLQASLTAYRDTFKARADELYDDVAKHLPAGTQVQTPNFIEAVEDAGAFFEKNPELARRLGIDNWDRIAAEAAQNGMPWQALRQFRSDVGSAVGSIRGPLANDGDARLKSIYGALTEDMDAAATMAGGDAARAWKRANDYYRRGADRIARSLDKTISADSPERAFEAFANMTREGRATSDIRRVREIKASVGPDEWRQLAASIIDRLGRARPGAQNAAGEQFSPVTFLTEWNKLGKDAKSVLLPKETRNQLDRLARVAESAKASGAERNASNTGTLVVATAGASMAPVTAVSILAGANVAAKAMTSPRFLRAMNKAARGDLRPMQAIANKRGPLMADAETILRLYAAETAANQPQQPARAVP